MEQITNEVRYFSGIAKENNDASSIVEKAKRLAFTAMKRDYGFTGMGKDYISDVDYDKENLSVKKDWLAFSAAGSGIKELTEKRHLVNAFDNPMFVSLTNAIIAEALLGIVVNSNASQIMKLANIDEVDIGDSKTYTIETKGLPVAQRTSYNSNVTLTNSASTTGITVTPKVWTLGSSIDYTRVLTDTFDFGKEIARVALGILYAQYKLVTGILFNTTNLTGTPLYQAAFAQTTYVAMISYLQALNGGSAVEAYGTLPAFNAIGSLATTSYGFESQDEMIRNGFLGRAYGISNNVIDQSTDLSAPFITANLSNLLLVPNDRILLLSDVGDKPVKLVRESFIRVVAKTASDGSIYRQNYSYTMSFDAGLATQAHYAIQAAHS